MTVFVGVTVLAAATAFVGALFFVGTAFLAAGGRDAGTFFAAVALLAGLIVSSFPTIELAGSLTAIASRERVTIADSGPGGNTPRRIKRCTALRSRSRR